MNLSLRNLFSHLAYGMSSRRVDELSQKYDVNQQGREDKSRSLAFWDKIDRGETVESSPVYISAAGVSYVSPGELVRTEAFKRAVKQTAGTDLSRLSRFVP